MPVKRRLGEEPEDVAKKVKQALVSSNHQPEKQNHAPRQSALPINLFLARELGIKPAETKRKIQSIPNQIKSHYIKKNILSDDYSNQALEFPSLVKCIAMKENLMATYDEDGNLRLYEYKDGVLKVLWIKQVGSGGQGLMLSSTGMVLFNKFDISTSSSTSAEIFFQGEKKGEIQLEADSFLSVIEEKIILKSTRDATFLSVLNMEGKEIYNWNFPSDFHAEYALDNKHYLVVTGSKIPNNDNENNNNDDHSNINNSSIIFYVLNLETKETFGYSVVAKNNSKIVGNLSGVAFNEKNELVFAVKSSPEKDTKNQYYQKHSYCVFDLKVKKFTDMLAFNIPVSTDFDFTHLHEIFVNKKYIIDFHVNSANVVTVAIIERNESRLRYIDKFFVPTEIFFKGIYFIFHGDAFTLVSKRVIDNKLNLVRKAYDLLSMQCVKEVKYFPSIFASGFTFWNGVLMMAQDQVTPVSENDFTVNPKSLYIEDFTKDEPYKINDIRTTRVL